MRSNRTGLHRPVPPSSCAAMRGCYAACSTIFLRTRAVTAKGPRSTLPCTAPVPAPYSLSVTAVRVCRRQTGSACSSHFFALPARPKPRAAWVWAWRSCARSLSNTVEEPNINRARAADPASPSFCRTRPSRAPLRAAVRWRDPLQLGAATRRRCAPRVDLSNALSNSSFADACCDAHAISARSSGHWYINAPTSLEYDALAQRSTTTCRIGIDAFIWRRLHCRDRCLGSSVGRYEVHRIQRETETMKLKAYFAAMLGLAAAMTAGATDLVIATVNNPHMIAMQKLTHFFEEANPGVNVKWVTLEEGVLRQRVTTDIATKGGQFDVMTIGMYETPIWGKKGWLNAIKAYAAYDVDDLLPAMGKGLSVDGKRYP